MFPARSRPRLTVLEGRDLPAALLQVINNSPYPAAADLDVYINGLLVPELTGLGFREATPYLTEPSAVPLTVSVRPAGGTAGQAFFTQTLNLAENSTSVAVVLGDPAQTGGAARFQLLATPAARTRAATPGNAEFTFIQGSPDAPPLDVRVPGGATVADDAGYAGLVPGYTSVAPGRYTLDVTRADGTTPVGAFVADLSGAADKAVTVLGSGFVGSPPAGAATFGLLAVNSDGTTALLPAATGVAGGSGTFAAGAKNSPALQFDAAGKELTRDGTSANSNQQERVAIADVNGDGVADRIAGGGPGTRNRVTVLFSAGPGGGGGGIAILPFEATFTGGVFVAAGDLNGDGKAEVIVTPDQGGGPVAAIYDGAKLSATPYDGTGAAAQLARFFGIDDAAFRGGARAAVGDLNGDGRADLVVAAGFGGGPRVAVFNGATVLAAPPAGQLPPKLAADFFVFESTLRNGVFVTAGDVDADGAADLIVGGGPGGGPRVFAVSGRDLTLPPDPLALRAPPRTLANFFAGDPANRDGVRVAAKDLDGDRLADLVVGLGSAGSPQVRGFRGRDFAASVSAGVTPPGITGLDLNPFTNPGVVYVG